MGFVIMIYSILLRTSSLFAVSLPGGPGKSLEEEQIRQGQTAVRQRTAACP